MLSSNLFTNKANAQTQFSTKSKYKLPRGITANDIEPNRVWFKLKPEYRTAFKSSNSLSNLVSQLSTTAANQCFPPNEHRKKLTKTKVNKNISGVDISLIYKLNLQESITIFDAVDKLMATGMVEIAEPVPANRISYVPNDIDLIRQPYLNLIKAFEAWEISKGDSTVLIGIVDTGFDFSHLDLKDKIHYNQNDPIDGIDNDNDGYIDNHYGWDFVGATTNLAPDNNPQTSPFRSAHGTSVAGCAAASTDNDLGVAGTGFNVKIVSTKHLADDDVEGVGLLDAYSGIVYMAEMGVKIINCSWGSFFSSGISEQIVRSVVEDYGCLIIASAGNDRKDIGQFPASYDGVLSVGATDIEDKLAYFSNYNYKVDIIAPGTLIYTTAHSKGAEGPYIRTQGTSFSSPLVAGAAALTWSYRPELTPIQVGELIRMTSDPRDNVLPSKFRGKVGQGRLNMERALKEFPIAVRMKKFELIQINNGRVPRAGDTAVFNAEFFSYLAPSNSDFKIKVETIDNSLTILEGNTIYEGVMNTNQSVITQNHVKVVISPSIPNYGTVTLRITYSQDGYETQEFASIVANLPFITIDKNDIVTSVDSEGTIGKHEKLTVGENFVYKGTPMLAELGLMFSSYEGKLSNTLRANQTKGNILEYDTDFRTIFPIRLLPTNEDEPEKYSWQTKFNDDGALETKLSVHTTQTMQLWKTDGAENFVVVEYVFENRAGTNIIGFYAGLFGDWDIGNADINQVEWKDELNAAIVSSKIPEQPRIAMGVLDLFASQATYSLISNNQNYLGTPYGTYDGFTDEEKINALKGHSNKTIGILNGTEISATVSAGPYTIPAGEKIVIAFVLAAGNNDTVIKEAIKKANQLYRPSITVQDTTGIEYENEFARAIKIFPNPASSKVNIDVSGLNSNKSIEFTVLNILGQQIIKNIITQQQTILNIENLPAGQYILRFNNGTTVGTKTLIIN